MTTLVLPGLIDIHVHTRDPGQTEKEDWASATAAALAGGFTTILAMPNTHPVVADEDSLAIARQAARSGARCDYALYAGATEHNAATVHLLADRTAGLKMYLDQTFGDLRLRDLGAWWEHLGAWPADRPVVAHAEGASLGAILLMAEWLERSIHICHVSRRDEIELIARARDRGVTVTCEATPHHLFLDATHADLLGPAAAVKPPLSHPDDRRALWEHLEAIDCFATDHAPHTAVEKAAPNPPPGFAGLETAVALLVGAVHDGLLTVDDVRVRLHGNPARIFGIRPRPAEVVIDPDERWVVDPSALHTRCDWSPFTGWELRGRVMSVTVDGDKAYDRGGVLAAPGSGLDLREEPQ